MMMMMMMMMMVMTATRNLPTRRRANNTNILKAADVEQTGPRRRCIAYPRITMHASSDVVLAKSEISSVVDARDPVSGFLPLLHSLIYFLSLCDVVTREHDGTARHLTSW